MRFLITAGESTAKIAFAKDVFALDASATVELEPKQFQGGGYWVQMEKLIRC